MTRRKPYTARGISKVPCFRCKRPSRFQWQVCADGNQFRGLCVRCDIELNALVLCWMKDPDAETKIQEYESRVRHEPKTSEEQWKRANG